MTARIRAALGCALALILMTGAPALLAQDATPAAGPSILEAYGAARPSGDAAGVGALYTEDATREDAPAWTFSGVHPAAGREAPFRGASTPELTGGLISAERDYYDRPEMLAQIEAASATPAP
ncbi:MAG: hypothetical protein KC442_25730 [Thermomicrobiales bacterium]|nr:hypothetical protein [Thermomicrobiales bacterium]